MWLCEFLAYASLVTAICLYVFVYIYIYSQPTFANKYLSDAKKTFDELGIAFFF